MCYKTLIFRLDFCEACAFYHKVSCEEVYQYVAQLTPEGWNSQGSAALRQLMQRVSNVARERERFLLIPM
jgi:hypothetical protein